MVGDLVYYVFEEGNVGVESGFIGVIEIDFDGDLSFQGILFYLSFMFGYGDFVVIGW